MKKLLILIPLMILSCKKNETLAEATAKQDSEKISEPIIDSSKIKDSIINNAPATKEVLRTGIMREIEGNKIIKTLNADMIPLTITDEFTSDNQQFILKIKNFNGKNISGKITPENPEMNIRFNQIKLPNGDYDGPFGREISYKISEKGEIWLIIGKSNMASGEAKGKFSVNIQ